MYMVKITEDKVKNLAEYAEKMLHYGGMLMHCIEEMKQGGGYGGQEPTGYQHQSKYAPHIGVTDSYEEREYMGEDYPIEARRGGRGRYSRM